jgi:hypothetical protein
MTARVPKAAQSTGFAGLTVGEFAETSNRRRGTAMRTYLHGPSLPYPGNWRRRVTGLTTLSLVALAVPVLGLSATAGAATVPAYPAHVTAYAGQNAAEIVWTVAANGGSPLLDFVITPYSGNTAGTPITEPVGAVGSGLDPTPGALD